MKDVQIYLLDNPLLRQPLHEQMSQMMQHRAEMQ